MFIFLGSTCHFGLDEVQWPFSNSWSRWITENTHCNEHTRRFFTWSQEHQHLHMSLKISKLIPISDESEVPPCRVFRCFEHEIPNFRLQTDWNELVPMFLAVFRRSQFWSMNQGCFFFLDPGVMFCGLEWSATWAGFKWVLEVDEPLDCLMNVLGGSYWVRVQHHQHLLMMILKKLFVVCF